MIRCSLRRQSTLAQPTPRLLALACLLLAFAFISTTNANPRVDFNHQIRPLLADRCYKCHGPDENSRKSNLRLDLAEMARGKGKSGAVAVVPGKPGESELIRRITATDPADRMPPPDSNLSLNAAETETLRRWIEEGAEYTEHWAWRPVHSGAIPAVKDPTWARNGIDRFVLGALESKEMKPSPEATRERQLRRLFFDLTGLPPTVDELDRYSNDHSADAYEALVDRLLSSPRYGERMAVEWLDVARFADTYGYQADRFNHLWPWRDWVIRTFNRNISYDDFILWQIAGDLIAGAGREQKLATTFNRNHRQTNEGGSVEEEFRLEYNADRVQTTAAAFLGLTMECARCHDHKYDPITQKDFYRFLAFFNSTDESGLYSHFTDSIPSPTVLLYRDSAEEKNHRKFLEQISNLERDLNARAVAASNDFSRWLEIAGPMPALTGWVGHFAFDGITKGQVTNDVGTNFVGKLADNPILASGKKGQALQFSGENHVTFAKVADFKRTDPFTLGCWLQIPEEREEIIVLHHCKAGSDAGNRGYELVLEHGRASFALVHFWPGNALKVRTKVKLPLNQWVHVGISYDGSSRATGLQLYLDGVAAESEIVRDQLSRDITYGDNTPLQLGARFRGRGFKNGKIDELTIFQRALSPLEMRELGSGLAMEDQRQEWVRKRVPASAAALQAHYLSRVDPASLEMQRHLKELRESENRFLDRIPEIMTMGDLPRPRATYVLRRGAYDAPGEQVTPGVPGQIFKWDPSFPTNRLGLAQWLIDPKNPLTARVTVNRYWQLFFGQGLVATPENFGSQGELPSHPQLLDWLADWFIQHDWDLKALCRLIVTSATYRQSSQADATRLAADPENRLLGRGPKTRLGAEMLRDQALSASGLLVGTIGGPSVKPYQPEGLWEEKSGVRYEPDKGEGLYRRGLYTFWKRTSPHPAMTIFDAPTRETCIVRRQNTTTPLQALVLLNDPQFVEAGRHLARRALREGGGVLEDRLRWVFRLLTSRSPAAPELSVLLHLYREQWERFQKEPAAAEGLLKVGASPMDATLDQAEWAAMTATVNALLSYDETVFKR